MDIVKESETTHTREVTMREMILPCGQSPDLRANESALRGGEIQGQTDWLFINDEDMQLDRKSKEKHQRQQRRDKQRLQVA